jgi:hypothetical protein
MNDEAAREEFQEVVEALYRGLPQDKGHITVAQVLLTWIREDCPVESVELATARLREFAKSRKIEVPE